MPGGPQAMLQAFQQLMQDPTAMQAMMQGAQQMGIPPQMIQQAMQAGGGPGMMPGGQMAEAPMEGGGQPMPPEAMAEGEGGMPPVEGGDAEAMAMEQIDNAGATFDGVDAPTQNDIERLLAEPTDAMVEAFDAQFGDGAAAQYINSGQGGEEPAEQPEAEPPGEEAEEY